LTGSPDESPAKSVAGPKDTAVNPDTMLACRSLRDGISGGAETSARRSWIPRQTSRLLSPVVQVAFAPGVIGDHHDPRARGGQLVAGSSRLLRLVAPRIRAAVTTTSADWPT